jgi:hypothetical protein
MRHKQLFIFLLFLFVLDNAIAQFHIGIQGGSNLSKMDFTNNADYKFTEIDYMRGFIGGLVVQFINSKHAGVQAEVNYSQKGWSENDTVGLNNLKFSNQINYIAMPVLTHVNMGGGNFRGLFNIGPYIAYALSAVKSVEDLDTGQEESSDYTFNSDTDNRLDFGLMAGGGLEYRFPFGKFAAEVRYTIGLGNIDKVKVQQSEVSQFRVISVIVRYTMPLTKSTD